VILDDGGRQGLVPIGMTGAAPDSSPSDTERREFPGLATKSSVFAWTAPWTQLMARNGAPGWTETINLRNNTASSGVSVDVPTWAAGAVILAHFGVTSLGASVTTQTIRVSAPVYITGQGVWGVAFATAGFSTDAQLIAPFYDEPVFSVTTVNDLASNAGSVGVVVNLLGFVRNV
jgi:hypothetical protein